MSILNYLRSRRKKTASIAKERLQIILTRERVDLSGPDYLPILRQEILDVVCKYVKIDLDHVNVKFDKAGEYEVLELNVVLANKSDNVPVRHRQRVS